MVVGFQELSPTFHLLGVNVCFYWFTCLYIYDAHMLSTPVYPRKGFRGPPDTTNEINKGCNETYRTIVGQGALLDEGVQTYQVSYAQRLSIELHARLHTVYWIWLFTPAIVVALSDVSSR